MSAFECCAAHFHYIYAAALNHANAARSLPYLIPDGYRMSHEEIALAWWNIVASWAAANTYAVSCRYGEAEDRPSISPLETDAPYAPLSTKQTLIGLYKAMQCLQYQCSEGDTMEHETHGPAMRLLEHMLAAVASEIIRHDRRYESSDWEVTDTGRPLLTLNDKEASKPTPSVTVERGTGPRGDGLELGFDVRPSSKIRARLKAAGYKWHATRKRWYARLTDATEALALQLCNA